MQRHRWLPGERAWRPCAAACARASWDARGLAVLRERLREGLRVDRRAELIGEDEVLVDVGGAGEVALKLLCLAMRPQGIYRRAVERDRALRAPGLQWSERRAAGSAAQQLLFDARRPGRVRVRATSTRAARRVSSRLWPRAAKAREPILMDVVEEGCAAPGRSNSARDSEATQAGRCAPDPVDLPPAHGVFERTTQDSVRQAPVATDRPFCSMLAYRAVRWPPESLGAGSRRCPARLRSCR